MTEIDSEIKAFFLTHTRMETAKKYGVSYSVVRRLTKGLNKMRKVPQDAIVGELWRGVVGHEDYYQVSDHGRVRSLYTGKIMGTGLNNWYRTTTLCKNGTRKSVCVHQIVAKAFIPNPLNKPCVNHIDGDKTNNHVSNLEWATFKENETHSYKKLGKVATMDNLRGFSKEWLEKPLKVGNVYFRGDKQKKLYGMMVKGVPGGVVISKGYKPQDLYDFISKIKRGGLNVEKTLIGKSNKNDYKTPVTEFFYKIQTPY